VDAESHIATATNKSLTNRWKFGIVLSPLFSAAGSGHILLTNGECWMVRHCPFGHFVAHRETQKNFGGNTLL
jgi:hypothetical protein